MRGIRLAVPGMGCGGIETKDYDGEDWKPGYDADADDEERWKNDE